MVHRFCPSSPSPLTLPAAQFVAFVEEIFEKGERISDFIAYAVDGIVSNRFKGTLFDLPLTSRVLHLSLTVDRWRLAIIDSLLRHLSKVSKSINNISKTMAKLSAEEKRAHLSKLRLESNALTSLLLLLSSSIDSFTASVNAKVVESLPALIEIIEPIVKMLKSLQIVSVPFKAIKVAFLPYSNNSLDGLGRQTTFK